MACMACVLVALAVVSTWGAGGDEGGLLFSTGLALLGVAALLALRAALAPFRALGRDLDAEGGDAHAADARPAQERDALEASQKIMSLAMGIAQIGAWRFDEASQRFIFDDQFYALYATSSEREGGAYMDAEVYFREFVHPEDAPAVLKARAAIRFAKPEADIPPLEHRIIRRDGVVRHVSVLAAGVWDAQGQRVATYGATQDITERKQAEEALRVQRDALEASQKIMPLAMGLAHMGPWEVDLISRQFTFNDQFYALFATSSEREGGQTMSMETYYREFVHPEDLPGVLELGRQYRTAKPGASFPPMEHRIVRRDGAVRDIVVQKAGVWDAQSQLVCFYGANQDITERKRAEEALRAKRDALEASQKIMSLAMDLTRMGVWELDLISRQFTFNDQFYSLYATSSQREGGPTMSVDAYYRAFTHPEDLPAVLEAARQLWVAKPGTDFTPLEHRIIRRDGAVRVIIAKIACRWDAQDRLVSAYGVNQDITERKRAEEELFAREQEYRTLVENSPDLIIRYDRELRRVYVNPAFESAFGARPEQVIGRTLDELSFIGEQTEAYHGLLKDVLASHEPRELDCSREDPDGRRCWSNLRFIPEYDRDGRPMGVLLIARDISERKRMEEARFATEKMTALGALAGGVAHDFNNILGSVSNLALLAMDELPPENLARMDLERILASAETGKQLVNQILSFSRTTKSVTLLFDPAPVLDDVLELITINLPGNVSLEADIRRDVDHILGDPSRYHQVAHNLCRNAIDAMRETGGILAVSLSALSLGPEEAAARSLPGPGRYATLIVSDMGPGIPPTIRDRIFEPFFTTKPAGQGTGLGLAVVHGVVGGFGGAVEVASQPGQGARFTVSIPGQKDRAPVAAPAITAPIPGKGRILLVDNDPMLLSSSARLLEGLGYSVTTRADGEEALTLFRVKPNDFDILITDFSMPRLNGKELAERALAIRPEIPVILCTGHGETFTRDEALRRGIRAYLQKPIDWRQLSMTLADLLA